MRDGMFIRGAGNFVRQQAYGFNNAFDPLNDPKFLVVINARARNIVQDIPPSVSQFTGLKGGFNYNQINFLKQPTLNENVLNGRNTITFDPALNQEIVNEPDAPVANVKTLILVMKLNSHIASQHIAGKPTPGGQRWQIRSTVNAGEIAIRVAADDLVNTVTPGIGVWFVIQAMFDSTAFCRMQINQEPIVTTTQAGRLQGSQRIGGGPGGGNDMDLAEHWYYEGDVFADKINEEVSSYLQFKYKI